MAIDDRAALQGPAFLFDDRRPTAVSQPRFDDHLRFEIPVRRHQVQHS